VIGEIIEKYEVLEKIGEGGMAVVYLGRHLTLGRMVAIKVLHPHLASSAKNRTRFNREQAALESLEHPNILRIFDYSGDESERCFIVTEFIEGPTLRGVLDNVGVMMAEPAALIARELCSAMQIAHDQGIVHRDLKPENVMIDIDGAVKLMDFGIARIVDDSHVTMTGALIGSPAFMSPEQATDSEIDHRSDLFALGIVLYRMVTGSLPFRGGNPSIVLKAIIDGNFADPGERVPSLSPAMATIIRRCLCTDPEQRYGSAAKVGKALDELLNSVGINPTQPGEWAVESYLRDSESYEDKLLQHLLTSLVKRGRSEIDRKDTASALRTFNRVLALDGDNREVIDIIGGMRPPALAGKGRGSGWIWIGLAVVLVGSFAMLAISNDGFERWDAQKQPLARLAPVAMLAIPIAERAPVPPSPAAEEPAASDEREEVPPQPDVEEKAPAREDMVPDSKTAIAPPESPTPARGSDDRDEDRVRPSQARQPTGATQVAAIPEGVGSLRVITLDGDSQVFVDGKSIGWTPMSAISLPSGRHEVVLPETAYHFEHRETVVVMPDQEEEPIIKRRYKPARVRFVGFPEDAVLEINGEAKGPLGAQSVVSLDELGEYQFVIRRDREVLKRVKVTCGVDSKDLNPGAEKVIRFES